MRTAEALYVEHGSRLRRIAHRFTGNEQDAEDVVQETFIRLLLRGDEVRDADPWLGTVARNLARDQLRKSRPDALEREAEDVRPSPESSTSARELSVRAIVALCALSPTERLALLARDVLDLDVRQAAGVLGTSEASCKVLHGRARKKLDELGDVPLTASTFDALDRILGWLDSRMVHHDGKGEANPFRSSGGVLTAAIVVLDALVVLSVPQPALLGRSLLSRGIALRILAQWPGAVEDLEMAAEIAAELGDAPLEGAALDELGWVLHHGLGHTAKGRVALERAFTLEGVPPFRRVCAGVHLSHLLGDLGHDSAFATLDRAEQIARESGDLSARTHVLSERASQALVARRFDVALPVLEEALAGYSALGDPYNQAVMEGNLGWALFVLGDVPAARERLERSEALAARAGDRRQTAWTRVTRAHLEQEVGDLDAAVRFAAQGAAMYRDLGNRYFESLALYAQATALHESGRLAEAHAILDGLAAYCERNPMPFGIAAFGQLAAVEARLGLPARGSLARAAAVANVNDAMLAGLRMHEAIVLACEGDGSGAEARLHDTPEVADARVPARILRKMLG